jgi:hypothetical protein
MEGSTQDELEKVSTGCHVEVGGGEVDEQAAGLQVCSGRVLDEATWVPLPAAWSLIRIMEDRAR